MPSGVNFELVACNGGAGGAPFALDLKTQLVSRKTVPGQVSGGTKNMRLRPDGTPCTKTPGKTGAEIHAGTETVDTPWVSVAVTRAPRIARTEHIRRHPGRQRV
jgi:hypothetical protein